ncbi:MAG: hypothetical protein QOI10_4366, partial [Solirubrobacterales bacterium]|nr:hypothetical protein [Solirubrobacterales bacterium]
SEPDTATGAGCSRSCSTASGHGRSRALTPARSRWSNRRRVRALVPHAPAEPGLGVLAGVGWPGVGGQVVHAGQTGDQQPLPHGFHFPRAPAHAVRTPYRPDVRSPLVSFAGERLPVSR